MRVATFPLLVGALSECMACRHLPEGVAAAERDAIEDLWRAAARAFVTVVQTGLPSINICSGQVGAKRVDPTSSQGLHTETCGCSACLPLDRTYIDWSESQRHSYLLSANHLQSSRLTAFSALDRAITPLQAQVQCTVPQSTWQALERSFHVFLLGTCLPPLAQPPPEAQAALSQAMTAASWSSGGSAAAMALARSLIAAGAGAGGEGGAGGGVQLSPAQVAADLDIATAVLDCLCDTVLASCQHAPPEVGTIG